MSRRCDHNPARPRLTLNVALADDAPKFIRDAVERASELYYHPERFPEITGAAFAPGVRIRRRRTSLLEAVALTIAALARRCDRRTFRVGDQRDDGLCNGVPIAALMKHTGLTRSRQARAIRVLKDAGYQTSKQPVEELEAPRLSTRIRRGQRVMQRYRGLPAIRNLTPLLFRRLGFTDAKVKRTRDRAADEWKARHAKPASPTAIFGMRRDRRAIHRTAPVQRPRMPSRYYELELQVKAAHPAWTYDQVAAEARRLLQPHPEP